MNKEEFCKEIEKLGITIKEEQLQMLEEYAAFLIEYNEHTNLTAIKDIEGIYLKHFYDSLTIIQAIDLSNINSLIDVGTGAGFPGMVLKIIFPHINVTLLDSNNKKIKFLDELIKRLDLKGVETVNMRSEDFARSHLEQYDLVTARAVTTLPVLTELCLPMAQVNGYFIPLKATITEELPSSDEIIPLLNGKVEDIIEFTLPKDVGYRTLVKIKKVDKTPKGYPRNYDKIKKSLKKKTK